MDTTPTTYAVVSLVLLLISFSRFDAVRLEPAGEETKQSLAFGDLKDYIVYMGHASHCKGQAASVCPNLLADAISGLTANMARERVLHTYHRSFCGCVVKITDAEANNLRSMNNVVSVFPDEELQLFTTRSWDYLKFPIDVARNNGETDIIVGVLDSGIYPESPSFNDEGLGPVPAKWRGSCDSSLGFKCNKKLIGARVFKANPDGKAASPRDFDGHGTHVASTVAGALVGDASLFGFGTGTARGGVPSARIAVYKVCAPDTGCSSSSIMAGFDSAIADGCDILSVSLGTNNPGSYFADPVAMGSFHAMEVGIFTSAAAGNSGPAARTAANVAPWMLTVAATTIDRAFSTDISLGDGTNFQGISINPIELGSKSLIRGTDAKTQSSTDDDSRLCGFGTLDKQLVQDKIVLCEGVSASEAFLAGASGVIMANNTFLGFPRVFPPLAASQIDVGSGVSVREYTENDPSPTATIDRTIEATVKAPFVGSFSSRGPNPISPEILKPDLSAPGVAILAAWTNVTSPSDDDDDTRRVQFNIISGTSMACPHATAAAVYVKSFNPTFSTAAIQSALITTASPVNQDSLAEFSYGAGQINPIKAKDPGLIYEASQRDYLHDFLCHQQDFEARQLRLISEDNNFACESTTAGSELNYPSIAFPSNSGSFTHKFIRKVKNVGSKAATTYKALVISPPSLTIVVEPEVLEFTSLLEEKQFTVTISGTIDDKLVSGAFMWDDGTHQVKSPVVAFRNL